MGAILPEYHTLLMQLQDRMQEKISAPGTLSFNKYRAFKNPWRATEKPFRFVDGELIERFPDLGDKLQNEICAGLGPSVQDVIDMVEKLKRLR